MQINSFFRSLIFYLVLILFWGIAVPTSADPVRTGSGFDYHEAAELLADYLMNDFVDLEDLLNNGDCKVKIFNQKNELLRFGKEDNGLVVNMVSRADYLVEVYGIKYYILNK